MKNLLKSKNDNTYYLYVGELKGYSVFVNTSNKTQVALKLIPHKAKIDVKIETDITNFDVEDNSMLDLLHEELEAYESENMMYEFGTKLCSLGGDSTNSVYVYADFKKPYDGIKNVVAYLNNRINANQFNNSNYTVLNFIMEEVRKAMLRVEKQHLLDLVYKRYISYEMKDMLFLDFKKKVDNPTTNIIKLINDWTMQFNALDLGEKMNTMNNIKTSAIINVNKFGAYDMEENEFQNLELEYRKKLEQLLNVTPKKNTKQQTDVEQNYEN